MCPPHLTGFNSTRQYKLNRTPHLTPVKHLNQRICLTQPDKKKLFGGKSETELEVYLCTGKQKKKHFRREKLHRRLEIYPTFNASQNLTKKKKASQKVLYISVSILPSHVQSFTEFNQKKKKFQRTGSASEHLYFYLAKTEVYPKTLSYLIFDHFSAFILLSQSVCIVILVARCKIESI